jgi:isochorismate hydrolase
MILARDAVAEVDRQTHEAELRTIARVFGDVKSNDEIVAMLAEIRN